MCRVVVQDFLPYVKNCFRALFTTSEVEQLALTTPYALKHGKWRGEGGGEKVHFGRGARQLDLNMQLDVRAIGEALRPFAPEVFEEMERQATLSLLSGRVKETATVTAEGGRQGTVVEPVVEAPAEENTSTVEPVAKAHVAQSQTEKADEVSPSGGDTGNSGSVSQSPGHLEEGDAPLSSLTAPTAAAAADQEAMQTDVDCELSSSVGKLLIGQEGPATDPASSHEGRTSEWLTKQALPSMAGTSDSWGNFS